MENPTSWNTAASRSYGWSVDTLLLGSGRYGIAYIEEVVAGFSWRMSSSGGENGVEVLGEVGRPAWLVAIFLDEARGDIGS